MTGPPCPHVGTILRIEQVTPSMRRLVVGGAGIAHFATPAGALGPYLKMRLPACAAAPDREVVRTYSIRRLEVARGELQIDIVLHGDASPGSHFARRARPGDVVRLGGPGFIPAEPCGTYLIAGDQTALPAIAHIVENLPSGVSAEALIELSDRREEQPLAGAARLGITWLHRQEGEPSRLAEAVRACAQRLPDDLFVWAGAEAAIARAIRRHARSVLGLPAARCQVLNYWKTGQSEGGFSYIA